MASSGWKRPQPATSACIVSRDGGRQPGRRAGRHGRPGYSCSLSQIRRPQSRRSVQIVHQLNLCVWGGAPISRRRAGAPESCLRLPSRHSLSRRRCRCVENSAAGPAEQQAERHSPRHSASSFHWLGDGPPLSRWQRGILREGSLVSDGVGKDGQSYTRQLSSSALHYYTTSTNSIHQPTVEPPQQTTNCKYASALSPVDSTLSQTTQNQKQNKRSKPTSTDPAQSTYLPSS